MLRPSLCAALAACALFFDGTSAREHGRLGKIARRGPERAAKLAQAQQNERMKPREQDTRFNTRASEKYRINSLPEVPFDIGEMYSGLVPIDTKNASRALFFVFQPKTEGPPVDEVTMLNGGPGCSSMEGFFQENGKFLWKPGVYQPTLNPYSWTNLTNMLWVEQPVGTGFSIGQVTATTEEEIAQDFIKFFKNFEDIFGIKKFKIFVTGESYAGRYVPYISAAMLDAKDRTYYDVQGALVYDPVIGQFVYAQEEVPIVPYVQANNNMFGFNQSFMDKLESLDKSCGYAAYREKYFNFPASGVQPAVYFNYTSQADCDVFSLVDQFAFETNPCFDVYEINQQCPILWDVLSFPTQLVYTPDGADTYFNRTDVKRAMHAPEYVNWAECSVNPVIIGKGGPEQGEGDLSADPIQKVLPQVIEATNRVLVSNGDLDMIILTNGTLLAIQNMTWHGKLGFESAPSKPIDITTPDLEYQAVFAANGAAGYDGPQGIMGVQHYERGLMWAETYLSGHMQPEFQGRVTYRHIQWLLGHVETL